MANLARLHDFESKAGQPIEGGEVDAEFDQLLAPINALGGTEVLPGGSGVPGAKLDTTDGRLRQTTGLVVASGGLTLTTAWQDVPGMSVAVNTDVAAVALVTAAVHFHLSRVDSGVEARARLLLDGVEHGGGSAWALLEADWFSNVDSNDLNVSATVSQVWRVPLSAGAHTLKLQAEKTSDNDGADMGSSTMSRFIYQLVAQ